MKNEQLRMKNDHPKGSQVFGRSSIVILHSSLFVLHSSFLFVSPRAGNSHGKRGKAEAGDVSRAVSIMLGTDSPRRACGRSDPWLTDIPVLVPHLHGRSRNSSPR